MGQTAKIAQEEMRVRYEAYMDALREARAYRPGSVLDLGADMLALAADLEVALLRQDVALTLGIPDANWLGRFIREAALRRVSWEQVLAALQRYRGGTK